MNLVLASTSPYRRELLERLGLAFRAVAPEVDESRRPGEPGSALAARLAEAKARTVAAHYPDAVVIGSDQVAMCGDEVFGKPGDHDNAVRQLERLSGREVVFHTAVCAHHAGRDQTGIRVVPYHVRFRRLERALIERYLERERPYDCAASAKAEGLGIALIEYMQGEDPTALMGLPLIALVDLLREQGVEVI
ncbi:MAG: septum formation protein Maf [Betaproteobacteria bacterium RIFCSPLOWO2_02_FULL_65_24]|nr:MAG: septum formation protein Maf [Betaproteobacteria bacterium RIFCSPLOWO2_02_FULL_65_24]OGA95740.1 MAG: septum formation protein Maf [Betaproteobacteria bacterium RIFCSPLOWO2_12_FULL_66_14]